MPVSTIIEKNYNCESEEDFGEPEFIFNGILEDSPFYGVDDDVITDIKNFKITLTSPNNWRVFSVPIFSESEIAPFSFKLAASSKKYNTLNFRSCIQ